MCEYDEESESMNAQDIRVAEPYMRRDCVSFPQFNPQWIERAEEGRERNTYIYSAL